MAERIALVTGAGRGMGYATCRRLGELGMSVILTAPDESDAATAAESLRGEGLDVHARLLDVTNTGHVLQLSQEVQSHFGRVDVIVNNAGAFFEPSDLDDPDAATSFVVDPTAVLNSVDTNALGAYRVCQALLPGMLARGYGRIVNVTCGLGILSTMGGSWPGYRLSKAALNAVTRIFAGEVGDGVDVKVNSVDPGSVQTDLGGPSAERTVDEGIDTTIWLATLPEDGPSGGLFRDREPIDW